VTAFSIERHALRVAVESAAVAMCSDDLRSHLAGVHVEIRAGVLTASSTDGHRLVQTTTPILEPVDDASIVKTFIYREDVKRLIKALRCTKAQQSERVTVEIGDVVRITGGTFEPLELANGKDEPTPPYAKVLSRRREPGDTGPGLFSLNAGYVGDVGVLGRLLKTDGVMISVSSAREAVRFDLANGKASCIYVVMPLRPAVRS
jgi:DNA polymerase III sliding clamp (beta) subunit (PCNA family)